MLQVDPENVTEKNLDALLENTTGEAFPLISESDLPDICDFRDNSGYAEIEEKIRPGRYTELKGGADPTAEELTLYQTQWREGLSDMTYDMDEIPTCGIAPFKDPNGGKLLALVCRKGYSFSEIKTWLEGVFPSEAEALAYIDDYSKAMTEPRPAEDFLDMLLNSEEVVAACRAELGSDADAILAEASKGSFANFIEWFTNWRMEGTEELVHQIDGEAPDNDTFSININRSGPLYWIQANEFDDECYFGSEKDAIEYAESEFKEFITALAERLAREDEQ